jgi:hypothetical protein
VTGRVVPAHVVVDGANTVGSRPDGWWRDRPGAARRLAGQLVAALAERPDDLAAALGLTAPLRVHLVLEGDARVPDAPTHPDLAVVAAPADGDAAIVALVGELGPGAVVVTADRALGERAAALGARTAGPSALLAVLAP